jgi:hypothetical protein
MEYIFRWGSWPMILPADLVGAALVHSKIQAMSDAAVRAELSRVEHACFINGFDLEAFERLSLDESERIVAISCLARARGILRQPCPLPLIEADEGYVRSFYRCGNCNLAWNDVWSCEVDDDCPACGSKHWPAVSSEPAGELPGWVLYQSVEGG